MTHKHSGGKQHTAELEELRAQVTLLDETRDKLAATEARYKALLAALPDMIVRMNRDGLFLEVIATSHLPEGIQADKLPGRHIADVRPEFAEQALATIRAVLDTGQLQTVEFRMPRHGEWQELEARVVKNSDEDVLMLVRDITDHKRADEAMRESAELYSNLFHGSGNGMFLLGSSGLLIDVNSAGVKMLGRKRHELLGSKLSHLLPADVLAHFSQLVRQIIRDKTISFETQLKRKDGSQFFAEITATRIKIDNQHVIQASVRDVSDRKQIEASLHRRNALLETLNEIATGISLTLEIGPLLNSIVRLSAEALDVTSAYISGWSVEDGRNYLTILAEYISPEASEAESVSDLGQRYDLLEDFGDTGSWLFEDVAYYVSHVDDIGVPLNKRQHIETYGAKSVLGVSLKDDGKTIGNIAFWESRRRRDYTPDEVETAIAIAQQVSIAIANARLHAALTESERRWRSVVENVPNIIMTLDRNGIVQSVNHVITGSAPEDAIGTQIFQYSPPEYHEKLKAILRRVFEKKPVDTFEQVFIRDDGRPRWYANHISPIIRGGEVREATLISTDLTSHKQALHEINEQRLLAESLSDTAAALNSTLHTEEVFDLILDNLGKLIEYDAASILLLDEPRTTARAVRSQGYEQRHLEEYIAGYTFVVADLPHMQTMIDTGKPVVTDHLVGVHPTMKSDERMQWVKSHASAPIRVQNEVIGFLELDGAVQTKFSNETLKPLATFANQVAIAIQNARLFAAEREQFVLTEALRATAAALNSTLHLNEVLDLILSEVQRVVEHDAATVMLVEDGIARIAHSRGYVNRDFKELLELLKFDIEKTSNLRAMSESGQPYLIANTRDFADWRQEPDGAWVLSSLGAPIRREGKTIGFINLDKAEIDGFSERDGERLLAFANQAAIAIANARSYASIQRRQQYFTTLHAVSRRSVPQRNQREFMQAIVDGLVEEFDYSLATIMLVDNQRERLILGASAGIFSETFLAVAKEPFERDKGIIGWVWRHGESYLASDVTVDEFYYAPTEHVKAGSQISVPLKQYGEVMGVLTVETSGANTLDDLDLEMLGELADELVLSLDNVRLYEEAEQHAQELEHRVEERTADLAVANEEIRSFAYIVSHDLRGPLLNLRGYAGELRASMGVVREMMDTVQAQLAEPDAQLLDQTLREDVPESLHFIEQAVEKLDRLTSAILKLSRLGRRELVDEHLDMNELVQTIVEINHYLIEQRDIKIVLHPLPKLYADSTAMDQIFNNILTNAILYLEPDRPGEISIGGERRKDETYFYVRDNGRGIATEDRAKVFDIFRRAGKPNVEGEGMGLPYVQALIRRYGGHIWFDSEPGVGTTFHFTIPDVHPYSKEDRRGEQ